ncbi:MAG: class I SAM-dependent methyltransferase [Acidimicrobiia bacterium]|nr:class I SAM-dependent methyltransferase [Acidimicrobiia bacterium]
MEQPLQHLRLARSGVPGALPQRVAYCPWCGSVARDRFVYHCFTTRTSPSETRRVLETSPRLGTEYRDVMSKRFDYLCSDYDLGAHRANIHLDLQRLELADRSLDVVLTAHVLEHVPDYKRALRELYRVIRPGGALYLNVPVVAATTTVPSEPEYQVTTRWCTGGSGSTWSTARLSRLAFAARVLVPEEFRLRVQARDVEWARANGSDAHDAEDMVRNVDPTRLTDAAGVGLSRRLGFMPAYMFVVFEGRRPAAHQEVR